MIIARLLGGLGNQLFIYAAARGLALRNGDELKLDVTSGFSHDPYQRRYSLNHFKIKAEPLQAPGTVARLYDSPVLGEKFRFAVRHLNRHLPFGCQFYLSENRKKEFDERLLATRPARSVYMEGYWQNERYFKDIESSLRQELEIVTPRDQRSLELADRMSSCNSVSIHVRRLHHVPGGVPDLANKGTAGLPVEYYVKAMEHVARYVPEPRWFGFGDRVEWFNEVFGNQCPVTVVEHNRDDDKSYEDLWLMSACKHHIIADSTFSWWGAWLGQHENKCVVAPDHKRWKQSAITPDAWKVI